MIFKVCISLHVSSKKTEKKKINTTNCFNEELSNYTRSNNLQGIKLTIFIRKGTWGSGSITAYMAAAAEMTGAPWSVFKSTLTSFNLTHLMWNVIYVETL